MKQYKLKIKVNEVFNYGQCHLSNIISHSEAGKFAREEAGSNK